MKKIYYLYVKMMGFIFYIYKREGWFKIIQYIMWFIFVVINYMFGIRME